MTSKYFEWSNVCFVNETYLLKNSEIYIKEMVAMYSNGMMIYTYVEKNTDAQQIWVKKGNV